MDSSTLDNLVLSGEKRNLVDKMVLDVDPNGSGIGKIILVLVNVTNTPNFL